MFPALGGKARLASPDGLENSLFFRPTGETDVMGSFVYCDNRGDKSARAVVVDRSGRARASDVMASGEAVTCP